MLRIVFLLCAMLWASGAWAQVSTSASPPTYSAGSNPPSQTTSGGLRVQPQDGAGNDVATAHPLPVAITAGSAVMGKVSIDQTTPGTTNGVALEQIGSTTALAGAGATGAGSQRVTAAQDTTTIAGSAPGTAGTPSAQVLTVQGVTNGTAAVVIDSLPGRTDVTPTVQNAQYVSGNDIGGLVAFTLPTTARGILQSVAVQFIGGATTTTTAYCFDANPTGSTFTDKSTFTIAAADEGKRINKQGFPLTPAATTGDATTSASQTNVALPFNSTATIWCAYAAGGTFTPATVTDLRVSITYIQNAQ